MTDEIYFDDWASGTYLIDYWPWKNFDGLGPVTCSQPVTVFNILTYIYLEDKLQYYVQSC